MIESKEAAVKGEARANFASCEITAPDPAGVEQLDRTLEKILAGCQRCRKLAGDFVGYTEKAGSILEAALPLRKILDKYPELVEAVRERLGEEQSRKRLLGEKKLDLICTYACCEVVSEDERKKCSKFANNVLRVAHEAGVKPEDAKAWLKNCRLRNKRMRLAKSSSQCFTMRFEEEAFPLLAVATLEGKGWPTDARVSAVLAKAAYRCECILRADAQSKGGAAAAPCGKPEDHRRQPQPCEAFVQDPRSSCETRANNSTGARNA